MIQELRERRGKELTKLLQREWKYGGKVEDIAIAVAKKEIAEAMVRKEKTKAVAAASHASQKRCLGIASCGLHQGPVTWHLWLWVRCST